MLTHGGKKAERIPQSIKKPTHPVIVIICPQVDYYRQRTSPAGLSILCMSPNHMDHDKADAVDDGDSGRVGGVLLNVEFVSMNAASQTEKQMNQRIVRSVAMRSYRQKQQFQRTKDEELKKRNRSRIVQPRMESIESNHSPNSQEPFQTLESDNAASSDVDLSGVSSLVSTSPSREVSNTDFGFEPTLESGLTPRSYTNFDSAFGQISHSNALSDLRLRASPLVISPITPLGAGRIDPFQTFSSKIGSHVQELIDHCKFKSLHDDNYLLLISCIFC